MEQKFSDLTPHTVLGIVAHPDDLDVGAGGTMAKFAQEGANVHYLILTDGSKGSDDLSITSEQLIALRQQEQRAALALLGGKNVSFLNYPDGGLEITMDLKKDIVKSIRTIKPDVVVTLDPTLIYSARNGIINHPDHRAAGQATLDAVFPLARDHLTFPELLDEGYMPHKTPTVLLINFEKGNYPVDITGTFEVKQKALAAHVSQFGDLSEATWLRDMAKRTGEQTGYELAESFVRLDVL